MRLFATRWGRGLGSGLALVVSLVVALRASNAFGHEGTPAPNDQSDSVVAPSEGESDEISKDETSSLETNEDASSNARPSNDASSAKENPSRTRWIPRAELGPVAGSDPALSHKTLGEIESEMDGIGLALPVATICLGGGIMVWSFFPLFLSALVDSGCDSCDDGRVYREIGAGMFFGGPIIASLGGGLLTYRLFERRALEREIELREAGHGRTSFGFAPEAGGVSFRFSGAF